MTVIAHQFLLLETRSSGKSCKWVAEAIVNGKTYTATSRMAPANDLARKLLADGLPDAPMHVYTEGLKGCLVWRSFHKAAERTIEENAQVPVRARRYRPRQDQWQGVRAAPKQGARAPAGTPVAPDASSAVEPAPAAY
jgi:hypothetical protein